MKRFLLSSLFVMIICLLNAQTQQDTIYTLFTTTPVVIDGSDVDEIWSMSEWHPMNQVWLGNAMADGDFDGQFKVAWDKNYLYVLVDVVDNILSDDHTNPTDNYWNDDCVEIFIDEDRSGGNHQMNNSAFAYHCSVFYDVIDGAGTNGATINCRNNITIVMDTIGENTYRWEFAVKMFNKNFTYSNPDPSRVYLSPNKLMGFSIAYCDNDETNERENFIGSVVMPAGHENDSYINSDYFGTMLLVDPNNEWVSSLNFSGIEKKFSCFPNPVIDNLIVTNNVETMGNFQLEVVSVNGSIIRHFECSGKQQNINLSDLSKGIYMLRMTSGSYIQSEIISKQ